jgi:hypothetical protein
VYHDLIILKSTLVQRVKRAIENPPEDAVKRVIEKQTEDLVKMAVEPSVLVSMPFSEVFDDIYTRGIKAACEEAGARSVRVDEQIFDESTLRRVYDQIARADVIVADMTGRNANVYYEVGYAHALHRRVILLTQDADEVPFDLKHYPHVVYHDLIILKSTLVQRVKWAIENPPDEFGKRPLPSKERILLIGAIATGGDLEIDDHPKYFSIPIPPSYRAESDRAGFLTAAKQLAQSGILETLSENTFSGPYGRVCGRYHYRVTEKGYRMFDWLTGNEALFFKALPEEAIKILKYARRGCYVSKISSEGYAESAFRQLEHDGFFVTDHTDWATLSERGFTAIACLKRARYFDDA